MIIVTNRFLLYTTCMALFFYFSLTVMTCDCIVTANQTSGQKNEPRSTSAQIPYSVHHNELQ